MKDIGLQRRRQRAIETLRKFNIEAEGCVTMDLESVVDAVVEAYAAANASEHAYDYKVAGDALRQSHKVTW